MFEVKDMTVAEGLTALEEAGLKTACIHISAWSAEGRAKFGSDRRYMQYKVWDGVKHYEAKNIRTAVTMAIEENSKECATVEEVDAAIEGLPEGDVIEEKADGQAA